MIIIIIIIIIITIIIIIIKIIIIITIIIFQNLKNQISTKTYFDYDPISIGSKNRGLVKKFYA